MDLISDIIKILQRKEIKGNLVKVFFSVLTYLKLKDKRTLLGLLGLSVYENPKVLIINEGFKMLINVTFSI